MPIREVLKPASNGRKSSKNNSSTAASKPLDIGGLSLEGDHDHDQQHDDLEATGVAVDVDAAEDGERDEGDADYEDDDAGDDDAMGEDGDVVSPREGAQLQRLRKGFRLSSMCWGERP